MTSTLVDFYGFGKTPHPDYPLTVEDYADGVLELMDKLGIKKATLVGHSFGGRVAIYIAQSIPRKSKNSCLWTARELSPEGG